MNEFLGLLHLTGRSASPQDIKFGPDRGSAPLLNECATLNECGLWIFDQGSPVPDCDIVLKGQGQNILLAGRVRIDNRYEVSRRLSLEPARDAQCSDADLAVFAYRRWGLDFCSYLAGDLAFALWDNRARNLILARDVFGPSEIYFHSTSERLVFSSSLNLILKDSSIEKRPNLDAVALSTLLIAKADGSQTLYEGLRQIPSAHILHVSQKKLSLRKYWSFDQVKDVRYSRSEDYAEALVERINTAIACRLSPGPVGIALSGGLDSGTIANLAAPQMAAKGCRLKAYTSVPAYSPIELDASRFCADEGPRAAAISSKTGNIELRLIDAKSVSPTHALRQIVDMLQHHLFAVSNASWLVGVYQTMQNDGIKSVLGGQNGNATISWHGSDVALMRQLLLTGKLGQTLKQSSLLRASYGWDLITGVRRLLLGPLIPESLLAARRRRLDKSCSWMAGNPLNPQFAKDVKLDEMHAAGGGFRFSTNSPYLRKFMLPIGVSSGGGTGASLAAHFGMRAHDPTDDRRVIEYCLGVPESEYVFNGEHRLLIRRAMRNRLPENVLSGQQYGLQSADLLARLRANASEVENELKLAESSELSQKCLNLPQVRQSFVDAMENDSFSTLLQTGRVLMRGLAISMFLQLFEN